ncbi:MAG: 2-hydroxyacid dehydrogenase [Anaerolineae bacterium]
MAKVFVTRRLPQAGMDMIESAFDVDVWEGDMPPPYETLLERVTGVDGLLCLLTDKIDGQLMDAAGEQLKVISQMAVGVDNVDIAAATERGIPVGNTPGVLTDATADLTWALLTGAARRVVESDKFTRSGEWKTWLPMGLLGADIGGATLGIVGFGRIGQAVARRALGFNMRILYYNQGKSYPELDKELNAKSVDLKTLLAESDYVSLHTPLTDNTYHLISSDELKQMKSSAILINTARGGVVDPTALYHALIDGEIAYAGLDVTEPEPINMDSPLLELDNIIILPHIGSASISARTKMATMSADNLIAGIRGDTLPNCVNPSIYTE